MKAPKAFRPAPVQTAPATECAQCFNDGRELTAVFTATGPRNFCPSCVSSCTITIVDVHGTATRHTERPGRMTYGKVVNRDNTFIRVADMGELGYVFVETADYVMDDYRPIAHINDTVRISGGYRALRTECVPYIKDGIVKHFHPILEELNDNEYLLRSAASGAIHAFTGTPPDPLPAGYTFYEITINASSVTNL